MTRIGIVYTHPRPEEKLLIDRAEAAGHTVETIHDAALTPDAHHPPAFVDDVDVVVNRSLSLNRATAIARWLERWDVPTVNAAAVIETCGDKWATTLALARAGIGTPRTRLAFDADRAVEAADGIGYPVVTKPLTGSWARLVARHRDAESLESVIEHKEVLGHAGHKVHYIQEHVDKPGRDIRAFVLGDECICAIRRVSDHWITNTARGARAEDQPVDKALEHAAVGAARAVGGGILAVDLMETAGGGLTVHEVNATMEFRNSIEPTGVDIPGRVVEFLEGVA